MGEAKSAPRLMLGNEAIAAGAIEAGVSFVSCYPGTPSSEVAEAFFEMRDAENLNLDIEYSVNEKVAMEAACGAAIAGAPSLVAMKHVGLNVAADPLFTVAYTGTPGGLVVLSADDPGCHSSQNEQDNRGYARMANIACFEPVSPQEAKEMTKAALRLARQLEEPVMLRTTTRVSHSRGPVFRERADESPQASFRPRASRFVPVPAVARGRHRALAAQLKKAEEISEKSRFNREKRGANSRFGIVASGVARAYLADALAESGLENDVAVLELGLTWPLPKKLIRSFLDGMDEVLILEEGAPLLENDIRAIAGDLPVKISGKNETLSQFGEYSTSLVSERLDEWLKRGKPDKPAPAEIPNLPQRPPNLCPGCAHRSVYYAVRKVFGDEATYSSDIGCYTLGMLPPLETADFLVCMGSSVSAGSGFSRASGKTTVAFIGDSTFFHSGMTGLANAVFNNHDLLVVILDNGTTAMTGHQPNPGMAQDCLGTNSTHLDMERILDGLGIVQRRTVRAHNLKAVTRALQELKALRGTRVLLAREPCILHARHKLGRKPPIPPIVKEQGAAAEKCVAELACPAFTRINGELAIDGNLCGGCMLCVQIAPRAFGPARKAQEAQG